MTRLTLLQSLEAPSAAASGTAAAGRGDSVSCHPRSGCDCGGASPGQDPALGHQSPSPQAG